MEDLTPEHTKRNTNDTQDRAEIGAAYNYVTTQVEVCDIQLTSGVPAWYGWALREAFLAGITYARAEL